MATTRAWTLRVLSLVLVLLSLAFLAHRVSEDYDRLSPGSLSLATGPLLVHLGLLGISFLFLVAGWHLLLRASGSPLAFRISARSWLLGSVARYVPGKVASVVGRVVICVRHGGRGADAAAALVIEQVLYALIGLMFLVAAALRLAPVSVAAIETRLVVVATLVVLVFVLQPAVIRRLVGIVSHFTGRASFTLDLGYGRLLVIGTVLLAGWSLHGLAGYALVLAVVPVGAEHSPDVILAFVGSWAAGFLAFLVPAGLGVREAALALFLSPFVPSPLGVVVALLARLTWIGVELMGIALVTPWRTGGSGRGRSFAETRGGDGD